MTTAMPEVLIVGRTGFLRELRALVEHGLVGTAVASTWITARAMTVIEAVEIVPRRPTIDLVLLGGREEPPDLKLRQECEMLAKAMQFHGRRPWFTFRDAQLLPLETVIKRNNVQVHRGPLWCIYQQRKGANA